ncbi:MAG: LysR family transcriptional regulator [Pseudomonadota bacterium]|nr:LysR family transcriptional regulator [Pseudomonadota bacterium]
MMDSWDDMRVFLSVARNESLSGAGRVLKLDPATVGRRVARLEENFGTPLFIKSPQGYALTEAGLRLLRHAEEAEQAMTAANEDVAGRSEGLSGQIRIGAPDGCANFVLPQVCSAIVEQNPDLDVQIVSLPRVVNLSKREADLAVAVSAPTAGRLTVQKITDYKLHLAASRGYLRNAPPITSLDDLAGHKLIGYIPDMIFDKELDYLADLGVECVRLASNSVMVQFQWILGNAGMGIVHDFALAGINRLTKILPEELSLTRSFYLVRHADDRRLDRLNRFSELLSEGIRKEVLRLEGLS